MGIFGKPPDQKPPSPFVSAASAVPPRRRGSPLPRRGARA